MPLFSSAKRPATDPPLRGSAAPRLLFLDDDPARAEVFLAENPSAVWVQTAAECIARLEECWDEVHLDHDLGGEHFVDLSREDCGMEVVRWICMVPRPHLKPTRFHVHSHNPGAAAMMGMQIMMNGFAVTVRPFGTPTPLPEPGGVPPRQLSRLGVLGEWLRRLFHRGEFPDRSPLNGSNRPDQFPMEHFDFHWMPMPDTSGDSAEKHDPETEPRHAPGP